MSDENHPDPAEYAEPDYDPDFGRDLDEPSDLDEDDASQAHPLGCACCECEGCGDDDCPTCGITDPAESPRLGECDRCGLAPGEVIEPLGICCACWLGQGASGADCMCGPELLAAQVGGHEVDYGVDADAAGGAA